MFNFTYKRGDWQAGISLPEWLDEEPHEAYLERVGFTPYRSVFGSVHGRCMEIFVAKDGSSFLADVTPVGDAVYQVHIVDFPSLMMFIRDFGPAFTLPDIATELEAVRQVQGKLFQATHGHDADSICPTCDPPGWKRLAEAREANSRKRGT